jgi:hypothetical protein
MDTAADPTADPANVQLADALWSLPVVLLFSTELGWWNAASLVLVLLGRIALGLINARTPSSEAVARQVMIAR